MIKSLLIVSLCAFLAAAGFFSMAVASGVAHGGRYFWTNFEHFDDNSNDDGQRVDGGGPTITRTLAWPGGDSLEVGIAADVKYTQGPVASLVATGPKGAIEHLTVNGGELRFDRRLRHHGDRIQIVMTAPDVKHFILAGSQDLSVNGYSQDSMDVTLAGSGDIDLHGQAKTLKLTIAGSGDVDAADLVLAEAKVSIAGSGDATVGPTQLAEISIAGSGDVDLTSHPATMNSKVAGSGSITQN